MFWQILCSFYKSAPFIHSHFIALKLRFSYHESDYDKPVLKEQSGETREVRQSWENNIIRTTKSEESMTKVSESFMIVHLVRYGFFACGKQQLSKDHVCSMSSRPSEK